MQAASPSWKDGAFSKSKVQLPWRSMKLLVPHRIRRKLRSKIRNRQSPASSITALQTSINPVDTLRALQSHKWTIYDGQYLFLAFLGIFSLCVIQNPGPLIKTVVATLLLSSLVLPITRQFFLPALPIFTWLIFFYACQFIPSEYRPPIWVKVLPALENILYGANLSNILSEHKATVLDILAWLPYGIIHFGGPVVCSALMFIFAPPSFLPVWGKAFGYVNLTGVIIQVLFPCSPPWYENMYGLAPANYSIKGSPAGLAAIDKILGFDMYTSTFTASPMVFGAFPSLHSGNATIEMLFMSYVFPKLTPFFVGYVFWLWWATMYLSHHYAVDLVGGSLLSGIIFFFAKAHFLPRIQPDKMFRWDYDFIEIGEAPTDHGYEGVDGAHPDSDEWTIGTSSSVSSGSLSPIEESQGLWEGQYTSEKPS